MNLLILILFGLVLVMIFGIIFLNKGKQKAFTVGVGIFLLCIILSVSVIEYAFNSRFRIFVDLNFNPVKYHLQYTGNESPLPLPPRTAFAFKWSSNGYTYYTQKQKEEAVEYFKSLGEDISLKEESIGTSTLGLVYRGNRYRITIRPADFGNGSYLWVESFLI